MVLGIYNLSPSPLSPLRRRLKLSPFVMLPINWWLNFEKLSCIGYISKILYIISKPTKNLLSNRSSCLQDCKRSNKKLVEYKLLVAKLLYNYKCPSVSMSVRVLVSLGETSRPLIRIEVWFFSVHITLIYEHLF